jgi:hypothetical protein
MHDIDVKVIQETLHKIEVDVFTIEGDGPDPDGALA